ncbi:MAG: DUF4255 domain-containing protein [Pseudomonadota bacterium]
MGLPPIPTPAPAPAPAPTPAPAPIPLPPSPISVAAEAIAGALADHFTRRGVDASVLVGTPAAAGEVVKGSSAKKQVNLFFYRLAGSGVHASTTPGKPLFLTLFCLVTAFDKPGATGGGLNELMLLGEAVRFFHSQPLLGPLPHPAVDGMTPYRISTVLQQPPMEELNHIWGTQGTETPYRLSAAYEMGLVPVEPLVPRTDGPQVRIASYDVRADADDPAFGMDTEGLARVWPIDRRVPPAWLPLALLVDGDRLSTGTHLPSGLTEVKIALAGPPGESADFVLRFLATDGSELRSNTPTVAIVAPRIEDPDARVSLTFPAAPAGATRIAIAVSPAGVPTLRGHPLTVTLI